VDPRISTAAVVEYMTKEAVEAYVECRIGRPVVVVGASTGTDTHSVGIDAILNAKGVKASPGLETYRGFEVHNLGSQVSNAGLLAEAIEVGADAVLVSQTVTQQNLHAQNLTALVELVEAEGCRRDLILVCGGPRISDELAKELGFDAGFARGTYPNHVASFVVTELAARIEERAGVQPTASAPE
jgi:beta-lysine 5,6-aminomutase beta subunit